MFGHGVIPPLAVVVCKRRYLLILGGITVLFTLIYFHNPLIFLRIKSHVPFARSQRAHFHFIVPATSSNVDVCKLLLSGTASGYPTPSIVNYNLPEDPNPLVQHVAKISGLLRFLNTLENNQDQRLALFVDAYDVWLQLPPSVLIARYHDVIGAANRRLSVEGGIDGETMKRHNIYSSIVFNAEKVCFPGDQSRPECLGLPESTVSQWAYGPMTNVGNDLLVRAPRWLNSGVVMGPVRDLRRMLQAAIKGVEAEGPNGFLSDQYHMANLYGRQENARKLLVNTERSGYDTEVDYNASDEYHITIDYTATMFQTTAFDTQRIGWVLADGSEGEAGEVWSLPKDLTAAPPPFSATNHEFSRATKAEEAVELDHTRDPQPVNQPFPLVSLSWRDVLLGANAATKEIFSVIHFTVDKDCRQKWWNRMWFFPYGNAIVRKAEQEEAQDRSLVIGPGGRDWWSAEGGRSRSEQGETKGNRAGAWTEAGAFLPWNSLCGAYEHLLFRDI